METPKFEHLNIVLSETDIARREVMVPGTTLPLTDSAQVGDILHIPVPASKYTVTPVPEWIEKQVLAEGERLFKQEGADGNS